MTAPVPPVPSRLVPIALTAVLAALCGTVFWLTTSVSKLTERSERASQELTQVLKELNRIRIEQSAQGKGIHALIEKMVAYAPILTEAQVTKPDFLAAKKEMEAVHRAVESIGPD